MVILPAHAAIIDDRRDPRGELLALMVYLPSPIPFPPVGLVAFAFMESGGTAPPIEPRWKDTIPLVVHPVPREGECE